MELKYTKRGYNPLPKDVSEHNILWAIRNAQKEVRERGSDDPARFAGQRRINFLVDWGYELFAQMNGWIRGEREFGLLSVESGKRLQQDRVWEYRFNGEAQRWWDHGVFFRAPPNPSRPVALLSQPYGDAKPNLDFVYHDSFWKGNRQGHDFRSMDLECLEPPQAHASIYNPGNCRFFVIVKRGTEVVWLPEQIDDETYAYHEHERTTA